MEQGTAEPGTAEATCCSKTEEQEQHEQPEQRYKLPGLEGEWTLQQLVDMEMQHDPRLSQVRRSALPPEFWDARRRACNHSRLQRNYTRRKRRGDALRQEEEERLANMDERQAAEYQAAKEAQREAAKAAAAAQRERVAQAMAGGLRIVVDCSFSAGGDASDREVRSLCKQLELCAAANKRARCPVSLQFASFTGPVQRFALEGMHADRWPAARGHEAPLQQLFSNQQLVVLSPDAEAPLTEMDPQKVYVIGGLVDRTVQKGASLKLAQQCGAQAARLPIIEHLGALPKGKGVLNVNDVFGALLAVHAGDGWEAALEAAIPQRFRQAAAPAAAAASRKARGGQPAGQAAAAAAAAAAAGQVAAGDHADAGQAQQVQPPEAAVPGDAAACR